MEMRLLKKVLFRLMEPLGARCLRREFARRPFRLLDVGAGNHGATDFTRMFPNCTYYGIDQTRSYGNTEEDIARISKFWEMDLTKLNFEAIPDDFFDALNFSHVLEHLHNGDLVLAGLLQKLRQGGVVYIEYPRLFSTRLPSMRETLNFFDDETHCRLYTVKELYNILMRNQCRPIKSGVRRNWFLILIMPIRLPVLRFKRGYFAGSDFWDFFGFAEYVFARKK